MVRTHESLITNWTLKVLLSCVRPVKFIIYVYQKSIWEIEILYKISCPQWANVSNFRIGMTLDIVKRQKSIHRILCQSPVPLSRGSLSEKIILSHCKVWILSLMAFPHRSGFVVTWYFPQTCHRTQTHKHTHTNIQEKKYLTQKNAFEDPVTQTLHKRQVLLAVGNSQQIQPKNTGYGHLIWRAKHKHNFMVTWYGGQARHFAQTSWGNCSNCKGKGARLGQKWHW